MRGEWWEGGGVRGVRGCYRLGSSNRSANENDGHVVLAREMLGGGCGVGGDVLSRAVIDLTENAVRDTRLVAIPAAHVSCRHRRLLGPGLWALACRWLVWKPRRLRRGETGGDGVDFVRPDRCGRGEGRSRRLYFPLVVRVGSLATYNSIGGVGSLF